MNDLHNSHDHDHSQNLQVWFCHHCQNVHFKTANVMLNFSKAEFIDLTNAMLDIFKNDFDPLELDKLASVFALSDEVLMSETIA